MIEFVIWTCYNVDHAPIRTIGAHQIANWLNHHGIKTVVIDFCHLLSTEQLVKLTEKLLQGNKKSVIGISTTFWKKIQDFSTEQQTQIVKEPEWVQEARKILDDKIENISWVLGGANIWGKNFKYDWERMTGHAEDDILKWFDNRYKNNMNRTPFNIQKLCKNITTNIGLKPYEVLPIELSRGCQFKCKFCRYPLLGKKKNTYIRDYNLIEKEFLENYEKFGTTKYFFLDDTVNESEEKVIELAKISQKLPFQLEWIGYCRLDLIGANKSTAKILKDSGIKSCFFGIESFQKEASKMIGKGWNGVHGKEFLLELKDIWGENINFHLGFITGLANETVEELTKTNEWCKANDIASWNFIGLSILRNNDRSFKSEFDLNYHDYGYKFMNPLNDREWTNGLWSRTTAANIAKELNDSNQSCLKPASWLLGELSSLDIPMTELMNIPKHLLPWDKFKSTTSKFIETYYNEQEIYYD